MRLRAVMTAVMAAALLAAPAADAGKAKAAPDKVPPKGTLRGPANNGVLVMIPAIPGGDAAATDSVAGTATDVGSGVKTVTTVWKVCGLGDANTAACGTTAKGPNSVECAGNCTVVPIPSCTAKRDKCTFDVIPPSSLPGVWQVSGSITDKAGNKGSFAPVKVIAL